MAELSDGEIITDYIERFRGRLQLDRQTGSLTISNLDTDDSGVYQLLMRHKNGTLTKFFVQLKAYNPGLQNQVQAGPELTLSYEKRRTVTITLSLSAAGGRGGRVAGILLVLLLLIVLALAVLSNRLNRGPCSRPRLAAATGVARGLWGRLGGHLSPGKRGGPGGGEDEEDEEEEEEVESGRDVERGAGRDGYSLTERGEGPAEDDDDETSSEDDSSMEGHDLRGQASHEAYLRLRRFLLL
ncbi:uncharacterized protein LOC118769520 [Megalops cyprinoides]|uniref:uncharacterized protein LOC118769520 n=1 Tax=Megalops cyprinoides TaxID=118141 RepID=UPI001864B586|nr:uncharacterized protein LOC118769520 [Megalops cyprinoides]